MKKTGRGDPQRRAPSGSPKHTGDHNIVSSPPGGDGAIGGASAIWRCRRCGQAYLFCGEDILPRCGAILDSDVVLYGDMIERYPDAFAHLTDCEILLVVGTSFYTSTASVCVQVARQAGARVEIINESAARKVPAFLAQILGS